jgi:hypothetical protein
VIKGWILKEDLYEPIIDFGKNSYTVIPFGADAGSSGVATFLWWP